MRHVHSLRWLRWLPSAGAVTLLLGLATLSTTTASYRQGTPTPTPPPMVLFPAVVNVPAGGTIVFHDSPPPLPTAVPGQLPPSPNPAGCGQCQRNLFVHNDAAQEARVAFNGTALDVSLSEDVVLQLFVHRAPVGITGLDHCEMGSQQNHASCGVRLGPPFPTLVVSFTTLPRADAMDQTANLSFASGPNIAVLAGPLPPSADQNREPVVPMLMVFAGATPIALRWDEMTLTLTVPPGLTTELRDVASQAELPCEQAGDQLDEVSCPVDTSQSPAVRADVRVPAGWSIVGAPGYTVPADSGSLYTLPSGAADYVLVPVGAPLQDGVGYWVYNATPAAPRPGPTAAPASVRRTVPAGQFVMVGNARQIPVCAHGATAVYVYDPSAGYVPNALLQPGQGGWALSDTGLLSLDGYPATPCP